MNQKSIKCTANVLKVAAVAIGAKSLVSDIKSIAYELDYPNDSYSLVKFKNDPDNIKSTVTKSVFHGAVTGLAVGASMCAIDLGKEYLLLKLPELKTTVKKPTNKK